MVCLLQISSMRNVSRVYYIGFIYLNFRMVVNESHFHINIYIYLHILRVMHLTTIILYIYKGIKIIFTLIFK